MQKLEKKWELGLKKNFFLMKMENDWKINENGNFLKNWKIENLGLETRIFKFFSLQNYEKQLKN